MKKIFLTLGTAIATAAPLATVIACGTTTTTGTVASGSIDGTTLKLTNLNLLSNEKKLDVIEKAIGDGQPTDAQKVEIAALYKETFTSLEAFSDLMDKSDYHDAQTVELSGKYDGDDIEATLDFSKAIDDDANSTVISGGTLKAVMDTAYTATDIGEKIGLTTGELVASEKVMRMIYLLNRVVLADKHDSSSIRSSITNLTGVTSTFSNFDGITTDLEIKTAAEAETKLGLTEAEYKKITDLFVSTNFMLSEIKVTKESTNQIEILFIEDKNPIQGVSTTLINITFTPAS